MARTKTVFGSHANTAHVWAQNEVSFGYSSDRRMEFSDGIIYSYGSHFPIARHYNKNTVLFTTKTYSVSTSKHIGYVRGAITHKNIIYVPNITAKNKREVQGNLDYFRIAYTKEFERQLKKQKWHSSWNEGYDMPYTKLSAIRNNWQEYRDLIGWTQKWKEEKKAEDGKPTFHAEIDSAYIASIRAAKDRKRNDPAYRTKRDAQNEKARARVEFKKQFERDYKQAERIAFYFVADEKGIPLFDSYEMMDAEREFNNTVFYKDGKSFATVMQIDNAEYENEQMLCYPDGRVYCTEDDYDAAREMHKGYFWQQGENISYFHYTKENGSVLLRVKGDELQTSRGAVVPLDHAVMAFKTIIKCKSTGTGWKTNGHTLPVGHFKISEITPEGNITAGCHFIDWQEIERIAKQLNLI